MRKIDSFMHNSGFKVLAVARFSQCEYSILLYLINCAVSGLDELVTTRSELASLIAYDIPSVSHALLNLDERKIIRYKYSDATNSPDDQSAMRVAINYDLQKWKLDFEEDLSVSDAIVFPFRRAGRSLQMLEKPSNDEQLPTWERVVESFTTFHDLEASKICRDDLIEKAKVLVDTHLVDQVLLLLRHFGERITDLSLLASSWKHYVEMFEEETMKVDFSSARKKHLEQEQALQKRAKDYLDQALVKQLNSEEVSVLKIIIHHRHPRRQLFWAHQARTRYPNLMQFFNDNEDLMLPLTMAGQMVRRPTKPEISPE